MSIATDIDAAVRAMTLNRSSPRHTASDRAALPKELYCRRARDLRARAFASLLHGLAKAVAARFVPSRPVAQPRV